MRSTAKKSVSEELFKPPDNLHITSDGTKLKLISSHGKIHVYEYTEGEYKKGMTVTYDSDYLKKQLQNYFRNG